MRKNAIVILLALLASPSFSYGQHGGNVGYSDSGARSRAEQIERAKRTVTKDEQPPTGTSSFIECNVMMNVKADEYVVVFGVAQEGKTLAECVEKMDATIKAFSTDLKALKIDDKAMFVDFVAQNRIYGFEVKGDILEEKLVGFELKKNILIHYQDPTLFEKITLAAARSQIFDLIKVDYVVKDIGQIQDQLMKEASRIAKTKVARYEKLLDIKLKPPAQVYAEKSAIHYPTQMYDSYIASESEAIRSPADRQRYTVQSARKSRTFYYNGLNANGFDSVINPVITEPVVQFTLYLKLKYEVAQPAAK